MIFESAKNQEASGAEQQDRFVGDHWEVANDLEMASDAAQALEARLLAAGWTDDEVGDFHIAVDESIKNAIIHGNLGIEHADGESKAEYDAKVLGTIRDLSVTAANGTKVSVDISFARRKDDDGVEKEGVEVVVTGDIKRELDEKQLKDMTSPERLLAPDGRGIGMMWKSSDKVDISLPTVTLWKFKKTGDELRS